MNVVEVPASPAVAIVCPSALHHTPIWSPAAHLTIRSVPSPSSTVVLLLCAASVVAVNTNSAPAFGPFPGLSSSLTQERAEMARAKTNMLMRCFIFFYVRPVTNCNSNI